MDIKFEGLSGLFDSADEVADTVGHGSLSAKLGQDLWHSTSPGGPSRRSGLWGWLTAILDRKEDRSTKLKRLGAYEQHQSYVRNDEIVIDWTPDYLASRSSNGVSLALWLRVPHDWETNYSVVEDTDSAIVHSIIKQGSIRYHSSAE